MTDDELLSAYWGISPTAALPPGNHVAAPPPPAVSDAMVDAAMRW